MKNIADYTVEEFEDLKRRIDQACRWIVITFFSCVLIASIIKLTVSFVQWLAHAR